MIVTINYNLPDDLELFKRHLKDREAYSLPLGTEDVRALKQAILDYLLKNDHDSLIHLNKTLDKYSKI